MRGNGRLSKADLPSSIKHPILLDKGHHITSLIVQVDCTGQAVCKEATVQVRNLPKT